MESGVGTRIAASGQYPKASRLSFSPKDVFNGFYDAWCLARGHYEPLEKLMHELKLTSIAWPMLLIYLSTAKRFAIHTRSSIIGGGMPWFMVDCTIGSCGFFGASSYLNFA